MTGSPIVLVGGGRWARVVLSVLTSLRRVPRVIWVSYHGLETNRAWLAAQQLPGVTLRSDTTSIWDAQPKAIIIANSTSQHARVLEEALDRKIPALCEKPFALDLSTAQRLVKKSQQNQIPTGVNLEFMHASYLHDFKKLIAHRALTYIDIIWRDPLSEVRHGEIKYGDVYTPLVHDSLPHCWSLLHVLTNGDPVTLTDIFYGTDALISIEARCGDIPVKFTLNRRADRRDRVVSINGNEAILDFADEPGTICLNGKQCIQNEWSGDRPLSASLTAFIDAVENPSTAYPSAIEHCIQSVAFSEHAFERLNTIFLERLSDLEGRGQLDPRNPQVQDILIDMMAPHFETRPKVQKQHEIITFCETVIRHRLWANKPMSLSDQFLR